MFLASDLWFDQPDALERVEERLAAGQIDGAEAERLHQFIDRGYLTFQLDADPQLYDRLLAGVDRLWSEKPSDLAYAYDGPARPFSEAEERRDRQPRYRLHDLHSHLPEARELYLHRQIFDFLNLLAGREVVSIQSLFFEYGSQQVLHRDTVVVPTGAPSHLFGCWIALEDIHPDCGALAYVPGSHRLPYFEFAPGEYQFDAQRMGDEEIREGMAFEEEQCHEHGLEPRLFTAKKGEVLIWHASLRHGGGPVRDPSLTRKSFVVHVSIRDTYPARSSTVFDRVPGPDGEIEERPRVMETRELLEHDGCRGFDNPMRGRVA
jgi:phytanoyl-CoA hydroxylase